MAKRKKSKKKTPSERVDSAQPALETSDSAEAVETESVGAPEAESVPAEGTATLASSDPVQEADAVATEPSPVPEDPSGGETVDTDGASAQATAWPENVEAAAPEGVPAASSEFAEVWQGAEGAAQGEGAPSMEGEAATEGPFGEFPQTDGAGEIAAEGEGAAPESDQLPAIIESLLFASDKPLGLTELKRLLGERDGKKVNAAVQVLIERRKGAGIEVATLSNGWHLRTNPDYAVWVSKLLVGRPVRLSRAMLETLAIVAYRQPVTRPEVDDIRGVDCGAVLKTLLDRGLIRIIGKKEEVGRPMLYGTTPEFLRVFNLRDLTELPTLREFYDLSAEDQSKVEAEHGPSPDAPENQQTPSATTAKPDVALNRVARGELSPEDEDTDPLLDELDEASQIAKKVLGDLDPRKAGKDEEPASESATTAAPDNTTDGDATNTQGVGE